MALSTGCWFCACSPARVAEHTTAQIGTPSGKGIQGDRVARHSRRWILFSRVSLLDVKNQHRQNLAKVVLGVHP